MKIKAINIRIVGDHGNLYYLTKTEKGKMFLTSKDNTPLSLGYITSNPAELRIAMQPVNTVPTALQVLRKHMFERFVAQSL